MATPYHHAESTAKTWGGKAEDYLEIHQWFDASKAYVTTVKHRALRHHTEGILECERLFGAKVINSDGKSVPVRLIGEQHVREDLHFIPTLAEWFETLEIVPWMRVGKPAFKPGKTGNLLKKPSKHENAKHKKKNSPV